jgi:hypothetical protein
MATAWSSLRTRIRQRSDNEYTDGEFVTDAELLDLANQSRKQLFARLVKYGLHTVTESNTDISPTAGSALTYALPNDFYAVAGVFRQEDQAWIRLSRHDQRHYPRDEIESVASTYRIHGYMEDAVIELAPRVESGTYRIRYIPMPADLALDADTVDGIAGWEEWIVLDVAIKVLHKEQILDVADRLQGRLNALQMEIEAQAADRDLLEGFRVQSVRNGRNNFNSLRDQYGFLPGGNRGVKGYWGPL